MRIEWKSIGTGSLLLIGLMLLVTAGCTHRIGNFSVLSSGAPQYGAMDEATIVQNVEGKDRRLWFLCIPLAPAPNIQEAVDDCLDKGGGDFMERVRFYETDWSIILLSYGSYSVVGDVGNSKNGHTAQLTED